MQTITDWDDAYANAEHIPDAMSFPETWQQQSQAFRQQHKNNSRIDLHYGDGDRNKLDLFLPANQLPSGLVVFVHGGYWKAFDKSAWSHLANGPLERGFAVALPSYTLCPDARIQEITREIASAIELAAGEVDGPVHLTGHSAGGHLVTRMVSHTTPLASDITARVRNVVSISGVHDLRPLLKTGMNDILGLDDNEARNESPMLLEPLAGTRLTCWVGQQERPEFVRQNSALASNWYGLGASTSVVEEPGLHHFNVIDGLKTSDHPINAALLD